MPENHGHGSQAYEICYTCSNRTNVAPGVADSAAKLINVTQCIWTPDYPSNVNN